MSMLRLLAVLAVSLVVSSEARTLRLRSPTKDKETPKAPAKPLQVVAGAKATAPADATAPPVTAFAGDIDEIVDDSEAEAGDMSKAEIAKASEEQPVEHDEGTEVADPAHPKSHGIYNAITGKVESFMQVRRKHAKAADADDDEEQADDTEEESDEATTEEDEEDTSADVDEAASEDESEAASGVSEEEGDAEDADDAASLEEVSEDSEDSEDDDGDADEAEDDKDAAAESELDDDSESDETAADDSEADESAADESEADESAADESEADA